MNLNENVNDSGLFSISERGAGRNAFEDDFFSNKMASYVADAGILNSIESFLDGLPDSVRSKMTAGELADHLLSVIRDLRRKFKEGKE